MLPSGITVAATRDAIKANQGKIRCIDVGPCSVSAHWLRTFSSAIAGVLTISLSSCSSLKAPNTLFITYAVNINNFKDDKAQVELFLEKHTEAFQRSNPETQIIYITYPFRKLIEQITLDSRLNLGPDLIIVSGVSGIRPPELRDGNLTSILPDKQYFDAIYNSQIQSTAKENGDYSFAPWIVSTQLACFNNTKIKKSPNTIQELEELSASGYKVGLASRPGDLIWSAGTQGAIAELSSIDGQITGVQQQYPAIRGWLEWLRKAALYQNIYFEPQELLLENFKNDKLDWVTCKSEHIRNLRDKMGNTLSFAALPNGSKAKAAPVIITYGFALGKNSSPAQRRMALKFIKTNVNTIAQRKLQLSNTGFLAANQNVSIPPKSSRELNALNTSLNEQSKFYSKEWPGVYRWIGALEKNSQRSAYRYKQLISALSELTDGYLSVNEAFKIITSTTTN